MSRLKRENVLSARTARAIRLYIERHTQRDYDVVILSDTIVEYAQDLLDRYPLRAYDAVQLASTLVSNMRLIAANLSSLIFVTSDTRLLNAATSEGLQTHQPI